MNKKMSKRQRDLKTKLMAAICMLLVSSIMMVSTTYAWFTLSTAPEVTGITTAVGANGNLEMALLPVDGAVTEDADYGITSGTGDSMASRDVTEANITWGNLVDLSAMDGTDNAYGLDKITLYPAAMNETQEGYVNTSIFLKTPIYGADGRVAQVSANTATGVYSANKFQQSVVVGDTTVNAPTGVRAIGTVSNMTQQQVDFRAAMAAASSLAVRAQNAAETVLTNNGSKLAEIAIKHYKGHGSETYTSAEVATLKAMTEGLLQDEGAIDLLEQAIKQYVWAYHVANVAGYDADRTNILNATDVKTLLTYVPEGSVYATMINKLVVNVEGATGAPDGGTKGKTQTADNELGALGDNVSWSALEVPLSRLANMNSILLEGKTMSNVSQGEIMSAVLNGNLTLTLPTGSGVFADIADHAGDYGASINVDAGAYDADLAGQTIKASMKTKTTADDGGYQAQAKIELSEVTLEGADEETAAITDYYGYIIDLAFRTNASGSNLCLQSEAVDRIYNSEQNKTNSTEETMGHGSSMTFSGMGSFQDANVLQLMKNIRLVFFNPEDGEIYAYGYLDDTNVDYSNGVTMNMHLSSTNPKTATTPIDGDAIMELTQNQAHRVSVLVYLDGESITNKDVAYDAAMSMYGSINLQFASSANLVPMDYSGLASIEGNDTPANPNVPEITGTITPTVTIDSAVTDLTSDKVSAVAESASGYGFTVTGYDSTKHVVTATVNSSTSVTLIPAAEGNFGFAKPDGVETINSVEINIAAVQAGG